MKQDQKEALIRVISGSISALIRDTLALDRVEVAHKEGRIDDEHLEEIQERVRGSKGVLENSLERLLL